MVSGKLLINLSTKGKQVKYKGNQYDSVVNIQTRIHILLLEA